MKILAIIPARGGSKRIPSKNIVEFMGEPLISWTIRAAQNAQIFHRIIVSTDSNEIAEVCIKYGLNVPFLRNDKFDDFSPVSEATIAAIKQTENFYDEKYDIVVQLMPNAPLRNEFDIIEHVNAFQYHNRNFQISCFRFGWMNPWWAFKKSENGTGSWLLSEGVGKRSQDLDDLYCPSGVIWIATVEELKRANSFYGPGFCFQEIDWQHAVDIDTYDDLNFAKAVFYLKNTLLNR